MAYLDKIKVGNTTYDIQDSNLKSGFDGNNDLIGNVNYQGTPNEYAGSSVRISVKQTGNVLLLNNSSPTAETTTIKQRLYRLNNGLAFQSVSNFNTDTLHFPLTAGHKYRFLVKKISGSVSIQSEGQSLRAFVVDSDTTEAGENSPAYVDVTELTGEQSVDFTAGEAESINIVIRTSNGILCTNLVLAVYLIDLTESQRIIDIDSVPTENSGNAVASGGVFDAIENAKNSIGVVLVNYPNENFLNANIDETDGSVTGGSMTVVSELIDIDSIFSAFADSPVRMTVYKYAADASYISSEYVGNKADIDYFNQVKKDTPTVKYIRIRYGGSATPIRVASLETYHVAVKQFESVRNENAFFNLSGVTLTTDKKFIVQLNEECKNKNMIVTCESSFTGEQPTIQFSRKWRNYDDSARTVSTAIYPIGAANNMMRNEWRVPAWLYPGGDMVFVTITVPEGSTLKIRNISNYYSESARDSENNFIMQAHGTSGFGAPHNTLAQFEGAARLGFKYCIAIPKVTSDGVYVCLHDDDSIQATARNDDGTAIADEYNDHPVSYFTYQQLLQFDFGIYRGVVFAGQRIPLLADFFKICARTGMHPVLSVHPSLEGHWANIKALAKRYGVLNTLNIKATFSMLNYPMAEMLNEIESYAIVKSSSVTIADCISRINSLKTTYNISVPCGIEAIPADLDADSISSMLSTGLFVGTNGHGRDVATLKALIDLGVTRVTEDYNCSVGLNW